MKHTFRIISICIALVALTTGCSKYNQEMVNHLIDGYNYFDQKLYPLAQKEFEAAIEIDTAFWVPQYLCGLSYYYNEDYGSAMWHLEEAIALNQQKEDFQMHSLPESKGHRFDAREDSLYILHYEILLIRAAWCHVERGSHYNDGIAQAMEAYSINPHGEAANVLSTLYGQKGEYKKALDWAEKMKGTSRENFYYFRIAWTYDNMRSYSKAIEYYLKDIEFRPDDCSASCWNISIIYGQWSPLGLKYEKMAAKQGLSRAQNDLLKRGIDWEE